MNAAQGTREVSYHSASGYTLLAIAITLLLAAAAAFLIRAGSGGEIGAPLIVLLAAALVFFGIVAKGLYVLQPNQAALLLLFGAYRGTDFTTGLRFVNPLLSRERVSLRLRNFTTEGLKVNDKRGNPIEIAAAIVWRVNDTARAMLDVDRYEAYVPIQAEAAIRHLASLYAYDSTEDDNELTLRGGGDALIARLKQELEARFEKAGLQIDDARITHLAYAPEIAGAMLRRQQAEAVIAARKQIVLGAVSMVEMALNGLRERDIIELDPERRAAMVSNLMIVLCGESGAQPVINAGTLYP